MKRFLLLLTCTVGTIGVVWAQLPDFYHSVDAVVWVVGDPDRAVEGWSKLGFPGLRNLGQIEAAQGISFRSKTIFPRYEMAVGRIGVTPVFWVRPLAPGDALSGFLAEHGDGIFSLMHRAPSIEALEGEVERLQSLGVEVLQRAEIPTSQGAVRYVFLDTEAKGKYVLGLFAGDFEGSALFPPQPDRKTAPITQFAFAVRDLESVSAYWAGLGFPEMAYTHPDISELRYKDQPGDFDMRLGWQRHGRVPYEWTQSLRGPNVYADHLEEHGEGIHHIAFNTEDMDAEVERWRSLGFPYSMGGAWGEKGKPGSGRFVYVNAQAIGGTDVELLWNFKE